MATENISSQINGKRIFRYQSLLLDIMGHVTTVTHVLVISLTAFVIWLCCKNPFSLVTWHVFLCTIGWTLLMTEAILFLLKENILSKRLKQPSKIISHLSVQFLAVGFSIGGFVVIVFNNKEANHFMSGHGLAGLVATILVIATCASGVVAFFNMELRKWIVPNNNKAIHGLCGFGTVVTGAYTTITGYHTEWFKKTVNFNDNVVILCFVVTVIITVWTLVWPLLHSVKRLKNTFN